MNFYIRDPARFEGTLEETAEKFHFDTDGYEIEQNSGKYQSSAGPLERVGFLTGNLHRGDDCAGDRYFVSDPVFVDERQKT